MKTLVNGPDFTLIIWPTSEKEFSRKPEIRFRITNKTVVEPGTELQVAKSKKTTTFLYYVIREIVEVKESVTSPNQNIITAKVDRFEK
ncbi:hypothetical protein FLJC2902T_17210 [Flavobacterium limnosediminis JC2902]|uniref:Uncharacterized protein n=1 Tax=Flavobacterium limnosediminis JC2902 TaxID=1341181 RepID=V6SVB6_9FLAO|nr:hypothetical protein [Flavobacterium limnosediminis]ESU28370.1 hypothetical protein FLJC2902T_17210 [Flavobacterium limnosediminis JC2902]